MFITLLTINCLYAQAQQHDFATLREFCLLVLETRIDECTLAREM